MDDAPQQQFDVSRFDSFSVCPPAGAAGYGGGPADARRSPRRTVIPPLLECLFSSTHRLIPSKYSPEETVLGRLSENEQEVQDFIELDGATNARLLGEEGLLPDIRVHE